MHKSETTLTVTHKTIGRELGHISKFQPNAI